MNPSRADGSAFGWPGIEPRWTRGNKEGVGTAYSADSRVWFTIWRGTLTEAYYPTVDRPQLRDLEYLITDGSSFFHEEKRHLLSKVERISQRALGYRIVNSDPRGKYRIHKEIISDPHLPCILQSTRLEGEKDSLSRLKLYALCAPHLGGGGAGNNAQVVEFGGRSILTAQKEGVWLAMGATAPFARLSCGYVGMSDGWTDLSEDMRMDWEFDKAMDGNVALTGELEHAAHNEFTLGLAFGDSLHNAVTTLFQSLGTSFEASRERFSKQWERAYRDLAPLQSASCDGGNLYHSSCGLILAHEDKSYPGAIIASMSIPWGEAKGDQDRGGYHLVWTRDLVNTASALLAAGDSETPLRALIYLAVAQNEDGGFAQNFWVDGEQYWGGVQLDETAFPILLAWRLNRTKALRDFDPYPMILRAARYLIVHGPVTQEDRWEEPGGYSPSTIASNIAALVCAAGFARERGDQTTAQYLEEYADFLECHVDGWTATTEGTLVPGIKKHYIRILPADVDDPSQAEDPNHGILKISNIEPGQRNTFPAKEVVDPGFLELVRYGIRKADDPLVLESIKVVDIVLKVDTPYGPCWRRYNHDGYGQRKDGEPYEGWGSGGAWPLLTGERAHYEIASGRDPKPFILTMERLASSGGLLPEQVWAGPDNDQAHLQFGKPTGSAMPLIWAHAEYIKLLASTRDGKVFDLIPEVAERYIGARSKCKEIEVWKLDRQVPKTKKGHVLRIQAQKAFLLHWSQDDWKTTQDNHSTSNSLGIHFTDIHTKGSRYRRVRFTFLWTESNEWEGRDYSVSME
jgi:glucoamylase